MEKRNSPFLRMVYVCTHARADEAACANADQGEDSGAALVEFLREEVRKRNLKSKIRIVKSGCLDVCAQGPNLMISDSASTPPAWYKQVRKKDWPEITKIIFENFSSDANPQRSSHEQKI